MRDEEPVERELYRQNSGIIRPIDVWSVRPNSHIRPLNNSNKLRALFVRQGYFSLKFNIDNVDFDLLIFGRNNWSVHALWGLGVDEVSKTKSNEQDK